MARGTGDPSTRSGRSSGITAFQLRSQALRQANAGEAPIPSPDLSHFPDSMAIEPGVEAGARQRWRQSDLTRAIRAAEKAGLGSYQIEIRRDGTILIVVGASVEAGAPSTGSGAFC